MLRHSSNADGVTYPIIIRDHQLQPRSRENELLKSSDGTHVRNQETLMLKKFKLIISLGISN